MRSARSLTVSHSICWLWHACPPAMHPTHAPLPHMPPCHTCPPATHAPLPHMPPPHHAYPLPCTPPSCTPPTMHAPLQCKPPCHAWPPLDRILDSRFWKYYLAPTSLRPLKNYSYTIYWAVNLPKTRISNPAKPCSTCWESLTENIGVWAMAKHITRH